MSIAFLRRYPRWLWIFAISVLLLTTLPYLLGYASQGAEWRFSGFVFAVEDGNSYIAKMRRGALGDWLFRTPYTALEQRGALAYLPFLLLGKLSAPPGQHEQLVALYQLFRWAGGLLLFMALYDFIALFIADEYWQRWGVALASLGGGLGWLLILMGRGFWLGSLPLDVYSPETFGFLMLLGLPHLLVARALLLWGLIVYLRPEQAPWKAGLLWLAMGLFQPLRVPIVWVMIGSHWLLLGARGLWRQNRALWWHWARRGMWVSAISAPIVVYTFIAFSLDPVLRQWAAQNLILSPHPLHYLAAYGLLLPFALAGLRRIWHKRTESGALLIAWTFALPFLIYFPYNLQRRLAEGFWVVWVILALIVLDNTAATGRTKTAEKSQKMRKNSAFFAYSAVRFFASAKAGSQFIFGLTFITTLILFLGSLQAVLHPAEPLFRPAAEVEAVQAFNALAPADSVVLSAFETGNIIPAYAPVYVVIGHGPESVGLAELKPRVDAIYAVATDDAERQALLDEFAVDYIFWGPYERALGDWNPAEAGYLETIYQNATYAIFAVANKE